jgi:hypothetical protein
MASFFLWLNLIAIKKISHMSTYIRKYFYLKLNSTTKKRDIFDKNPPFNLVFLSKRIDWQFFLKKDPKIIDL